MSEIQLPKVYILCLGRFGVGDDADYTMAAIADDGERLGHHICSHPNWAMHDLHDHFNREAYIKKYGGHNSDGEDRYELVRVDGVENLPVNTFEAYRARYSQVLKEKDLDGPQ